MTDIDDQVGACEMGTVNMVASESAAQPDDNSGFVQSNHAACRG